VISEVNPSELVKCSSENICLVIKFFVKCVATSCVGSVINVKTDVNLQDTAYCMAVYRGKAIHKPCILHFL